MIEEKAKTFEEIFNEWYKKFLAEEAGMNNEIKNAKKYREEKLNQARKEAMMTIKRLILTERHSIFTMRALMISLRTSPI